MFELVDRPEAVRETVFDPIRPDYADFTVDVRDSFRWGAILGHLGVPVGKSVALYAFRSERRVGADTQTLEQLDEKALLAAQEAKGFIHYEPLEGLSYCLWESATDADVATSGPEHREAARHAVKAYEQWKLLSWSISRPVAGGQVEFTESVR